MTPAVKTIETDLAKPIIGAAWVGLVMTILDENLPKKHRLLLFGAIVSIGFVYFSARRARSEESPCGCNE